MALNFNLLNKENIRTLVRGFGIPLTERALFQAKVEHLLEQQKNDNAQSQPNNAGQEGVSRFGTPVYGTVLIQEPKFSTFKYNSNTKAYEKIDYTFSPSNKQVGGTNFCYIEGAILEVNQRRNIIKTSISGQDGTVKEFINNGDYDIKIMGYFATNDGDLYPDVEVKSLKEYLTAPVSLNITNSFLNTYFGVNAIVVESFEFKQVEGMRNVQYFTINGVSDYPFEVIELNA